MADKSDPQTIKRPVAGLPAERREAGDHDAYFNAQFDARPVYVEPGAVKFAQDKGEMLVATVGSGIVLSLYDQELKFSALAYILLPEPVLACFPFLDRADQALVRKAFAPIEGCIAGMKKRGAGKSRIRIRLFGGLIHPDDPDERGLKNTVFVREYLFHKGLQVFNADIGGPLIRRVHFLPTTGRAVRCMLKRRGDYLDIRALETGFNKFITTSD